MCRVNESQKTNKKTMKYAIIFFSIIFFAGCEWLEPDEASKYSFESTQSQILVDPSQFDDPSDDFLLEDVEVVNDSIILAIRYGGGCGTIDYQLVSDGAFKESNPVQVNVKLIFKDDDHCEALLSKKLVFDLTPLKEDYLTAYPNGPNVILLDLASESELIRYEF